MKRLRKRLSALLICVMLVLSFATTVFAAEQFWVNPDNGKTYLVDDAGNIIKSKLVWVGEDLYYFDWKDGAMFTRGWCNMEINDTQTAWHYFMPDGKAVHHTVFQDPNKPAEWYIFDDYYMNPTPGYRIFEGKTYYCMPEGHGNLLISSWKHESAGSRYFKADGSMAVNETISFGTMSYYFGPDGYAKY